MAQNMKLRENFYENVDRDNIYSIETDKTRHPFYELLTEFIYKWSLKKKRCLEIGSSKGLFQDIVEDYTGVDVAEHLSKYYHKNYFPVSGAELPFSDESFDAIWSYATHEHIPDIEIALNEVIRVLKPGGVCLFAPAWHTRPWFAKGYQVRHYSELTFKEKIIKLSIPIRDFFLIRWSFIFIRRLIRLFQYLFHKKNSFPLKYKKLKANYEKYWQSDSDACNSLDPFDVILWFRSRGIVCHGYDRLLEILFVRTAAFDLQKPLFYKKNYNIC
jgi:SAM-dependent methyltransferase